MMHRRSIVFLILSAVAALPLAFAHDVIQLEREKCMEALRRASSRDELVHPELRQILSSSKKSENPQVLESQLRRLFLVMQSRPKLTDRDVYFLIERMPRGVDLQLPGAQKELIEAMYGFDPLLVKRLGLSPMSQLPIDINILYLALLSVREVSRPDLWKKSYSFILEILGASANWFMSPTPYKAGVMGAFFSEIERR